MAKEKDYPKYEDTSQDYRSLFISRMGKTIMIYYLLTLTIGGEWVLVEPTASEKYSLEYGEKYNGTTSREEVNLR